MASSLLVPIFSILLALSSMLMNAQKINLFQWLVSFIKDNPLVSNGLITHHNDYYYS